MRLEKLNAENFGFVSKEDMREMKDEIKTHGKLIYIGLGIILALQFVILIMGRQFLMP